MKLVVSIPGGGIAVLAAAVWLDVLEQIIRRPLQEVVDLVAGTSAGAIVAAAIGQGIPMAEVVRLFRDEGQEIFSRSRSHAITTVGGLAGPRYDGNGLLAVLRRHFGTSTMPQLRPRVMVHVHEMREGGWADGGIHANNPSLYALGQAVRDWPGEPVTLLCVGNKPLESASGRCLIHKSWRPHSDPAQDVPVAHAVYGSSAAPTYFPLIDASGSRDHPPSGWGRLQWAHAFVDGSLEGSDETVTWLGRVFTEALPAGSTYLDVRPFRRPGQLDDTSPAHLEQLGDIGMEMVRRSGAVFGELGRLARAAA